LFLLVGGFYSFVPVCSQFAATIVRALEQLVTFVTLEYRVDHYVRREASLAAVLVHVRQFIYLRLAVGRARPYLSSSGFYAYTGGYLSQPAPFSRCTPICDNVCLGWQANSTNVREKKYKV
jgi:hypothetical protein